MNERELFTEALGLADPTERCAFLDGACGSNKALRERIEHLLTLHHQTESLLDHKPAELLEALADDEERSHSDGGASSEDMIQKLLSFLDPPGRPDSRGRIGHYEVLHVLGRGGFGIVVKAFDEVLHRIVAIKVLAPQLALTSPPRKRFLREARAAASVRHEHVVQIYAIEEKPLPYLVMEFVDGQTLQQKLADTGPLAPEEVVRLGGQIALGLAAAHEKGLIHRDVKPANILLEAGPHPRVKLTDFGLARAVDDASVSQSGLLAGTPLYMAPEQTQGVTLDHRADLFSFGSVLYTMCTGRPPFRANNSLAVMKRVAEDEPRPIRDLIPEVPEGLSKVISRLHRKQPAQRYASAIEVGEALARSLIEPTPGRFHPMRWVSKRGIAAVAGVLLLLTGGLLIRPYIAQSRPLIDPNPALEPEVAEVPPSSPYELTPWEKAVAGMPVSDQVTAVVAKLKSLNPELDTTRVGHKIEDDAVVHFSCQECDKLTDISPLRAYLRLKQVNLTHTEVRDLSPLRGMRLIRFHSNQSPISDLSPFKGMPLENLMIWGHGATDLSPLRGMPLRHLNCGASPVRDLSPLQGLPLNFLCVNHSQVEDLSPLRGLPLTELLVENTHVTDLKPIVGLPLERLAISDSPIADYTPLQKMSLKHIHLDYQPDRHAQLLRSLRTLETINYKPVAEVLGNEKP